jgi:hypothetical protein
LSIAQQQALVLGTLCLVAAVVLGGVAIFARASRFGVFLTVNLLLAAALFGGQVVFGFSGQRSQILSAAFSELPVVLLVCWICMAHVGALPGRLASSPTGPVVQRPRLRKALALAPVCLPVAWSLGILAGLAWPSPAMEAFAPAPSQFLLFKWPISISEGIWAGLAATAFTLAAVSPASATILRVRNLAFAAGMLAVTSIAVESALFAGVRLWAGDSARRPVLEALLSFEACMAALCFGALALGLALRYTPAVAVPVLSRLHTAWIPARERFESYRWRAMAGGSVRGTIRAYYRLGEAARLSRIPKKETEKALAAIQLLAVIRDSSAETGRVTANAAHDLYEIQEEMSRDDRLWSEIMAAVNGRQGSARTEAPEPSQDALRAALDLMDPESMDGNRDRRPIWFYLVAVAALDAGLIDGSGMRLLQDDQPSYRAAEEAYAAARNTLRSRTLRNM